MPNSTVGCVCDTPIPLPRLKSGRFDQSFLNSTHAERRSPRSRVPVIVNSFTCWTLPVAMPDSSLSHSSRGLSKSFRVSWNLALRQARAGPLFLLQTFIVQLSALHERFSRKSTLGFAKRSGCLLIRNTKCLGAVTRRVSRSPDRCSGGDVEFLKLAACSNREFAAFGSRLLSIHKSGKENTARGRYGMHDA